MVLPSVRAATARRTRLPCLWQRVSGMLAVCPATASSSAGSLGGGAGGRGLALLKDMPPQSTHFQPGERHKIGGNVIVSTCTFIVQLYTLVRAQWQLNNHHHHGISSITYTCIYHHSSETYHLLTLASNGKPNE